MTTVLLVRHGEIENPQKAIPFRASGFPLSEKGQDDVKRLGKILSDREVAVIYTSPILRCRQTAEIISGQLQNKVSVSVDERLTEVDSPFAQMDEGGYFRMVAKESLYHLPEQLAKGESAEKIIGRMRSFLDEALEKFADRTVIAVSHGDPIMLLWVSLMGKDPYSLFSNWPEYVPRGGCYELKFDGKKFSSCGRIPC